MKLSTRLYLLTTGIVVTLVAQPIQAQAVSLFDEVLPDSTGGSPPFGVFSAHPIVINHTALQLAPVELEIEIPFLGFVTAGLNLFDGREGFDENDLPIPGIPTEQLSYMWRGRSGDGYQVILTVVEGSLSGLIAGSGGVFSVQKFAGSDHLVHVDVDALPSDVLPDPAEAPLRTAVTRSPLEVKPVSIPVRAKSTALPETVEIDVLSAYTEQARIDAGGNPADTKDSAAVRALIMGGADDMNLALEMSEVNVRVYVVLIVYLADFQPTGQARLDLNTLRVNLGLQTFRTLSQADMVSVMLRAGSPNGLVRVCGQAFVQRPGCADPGEPPLPGCGPGPGYEPYAYNFTAQNCHRPRKTFAHETGHCLGGEHDPSPAYSVLPEEASFPFAFGYWLNELISGTWVLFGTIMSIQPGANFIDFYYSNPNVLHEEFGVPVGMAGSNQNAHVIELLAPAVSRFRGSGSSILFTDGFETGNLAAWSAAEGAAASLRSVAQAPGGRRVTYGVQ